MRPWLLPGLATRRARARCLALLALPLAAFAGCVRDAAPPALEDGVALMVRIVRSRVLLDAVRNADPRMRASTAAGAAISGGVTANFPVPPNGIAIRVPGEPFQPWSVLIYGDDERGQVVIEGYADVPGKPALVERVAFPPR